MMIRFLQVNFPPEVNLVEYALYRGLSVDDFSIYLEGGNFLANGNGICLVADLIFGANTISGYYNL